MMKYDMIQNNFVLFSSFVVCIMQVFTLDQNYFNTGFKKDFNNLLNYLCNGNFTAYMFFSCSIKN